MIYRNRPVYLFFILCIYFIAPQFCYSEVLFETDFSEDTGFKASSSPIWKESGLPKGWHAYRATGDSSIEVVEGAGVDGKNALKLKWDPSLAQPEITLAVHLTGDKNTGYDELYVRYHVMLPSMFKAGTNGFDMHYWKWGRLWQNTDPEDRSTWTENRIDSGYVVWNFAGEIPYTDMNIAWAANYGENLNRGSAGGEHALVDWFRSGSTPEEQGGYFESIGNGAWDINTADRAGFLNNSKQKYHTIEWRFKLASSDTSNDGIVEVWVDGVRQVDWSRISSRYGAPSFSGIPTARMGSGFNFFSFFDNMAGWNRDWGLQGVDGYIYVNDVVVSTTPIGPGYVVGKGHPPTPPINPVVK